VKETISLFLKGAVIGIANIIPGVSGGTMMLVLGLYERILAVIERFGARTVDDLRTALRAPSKVAGAIGFWRKYDGRFVLLLLVGAAAAVLAASFLMELLLREYHDPTYGLFFGIVIASIVVPYRLLERKSWPEATAAVVAATLTVLLSFGLSGADRRAAAEKKLAMKETPITVVDTTAGAAAVDTNAAEQKGEYVADHSVARLGFFFIVGAIAISAMILPGVSGSFLLLLFGVYFEFLGALNNFDVLTVGSFGLGCIVGLKLFAKLLRFLLARYHSPTMAFLAGLMIGSLWNLWPFKERVLVGDKYVDVRNLWPDAFGGNEWTTVAVAFLGAASIIAFTVWEAKTSRTTKKDAEPVAV